MVLKSLKLHKIKSAVTLNDSEKKAIRGRYWGTGMCTMNCIGTGIYVGIPHGTYMDCLDAAASECPYGESGGLEIACNNCSAN